MAQQLLNLNNIEPGTAAWDADLNDNQDALIGALRTWKATITSQGNTASPSTVTFQLQNANGANVEGETVYLRVRVIDSLTSFAEATTGTIAAGSGTTEVQDIGGTDKDLVFQSNSNGLVTITYTNATPSTKILAIGPAPVIAAYANHNNYQSITHA